MPRATVRCRVVMLIDRGHVYRSAEGALFLTRTGAGRSEKSAFPPADVRCILRGLENPGPDADVPPIQALRRAIAACACTLTLLAVPAVAGPQAPPPLVAVGQVLPDVVMAGLNGPHKPLSSYRGRPLIINVWASWCGPCRNEAASLERLAWSKAGSRYAVIGISTDDDRNAALKWLRHSNATISHYIDSGPRWTLEHMLGASTIPVTVLVDAEGRVVARYRGAREWDSAESIKLIERAFAAGGRSTTAR